MSAIQNVLVQEAHIKIFEGTASFSSDLRGWIANQNYMVDSVTTSSKYVLRASNEQKVVASLANDCNRMSQAAIESISGIQVEDSLPKSGAWGLIRTYYSSFFAAHSILRIFGRSLTQLDAIHARRITEILKLDSSLQINNVDAGFYDIQISPDYRFLTFNKLKDSHGDTWRLFLSLIDDLMDRVPQTSALSTDKREVIAILDSLKKGITNSNSARGNWLSTIRNSVNYRHTHGVWFPHTKNSPAARHIRDFNQHILLSPSSLQITNTKDEVEEFFETSALLVAIFRELLVCCYSRPNPQNKLFKYGSIKLLKSVGLSG